MYKLYSLNWIKYDRIRCRKKKNNSENYSVKQYYERNAAEEEISSESFKLEDRNSIESIGTPHIHRSLIFFISN